MESISPLLSPLAASLAVAVSHPRSSSCWAALPRLQYFLATLAAQSIQLCRSLLQYVPDPVMYPGSCAPMTSSPLVSSIPRDGGGSLQLLLISEIPHLPIFSSANIVQLAVHIKFLLLLPVILMTLIMLQRTCLYISPGVSVQESLSRASIFK